MNSATTLDGTLANAASHITSFVVSLGLALLKDKRRDWIDMDAGAAFCRDHQIMLDSQYLGATELETVLKEFFREKDEFYAPGVNLDGYTRRVGWDDVFCIRAYPHSLVEPSTSADVEQPEANEPVPVQEQLIKPQGMGEVPVEKPV